MALEDAINRSSVILPEHKPELLRCLKTFPVNLEKWLYGVGIADASTLFQGDIILDIPVCFIDDSGETLLGKDAVALISHTCDMQLNRHDFIVVSPIVSFDEYKFLNNYEENKERIDDLLTAIRKNDIFRYFYLPAQKGLPESFIDFSRMVTISNAFLNSIKAIKAKNCILSLSQIGSYLFLIKLTYHLARMERPSQN
ncbi:MAG: hypothetical protein Q7T83_01160 [Thermodesulfovibrionales bacterium]|nr:MAG: hypothetical protein FD156_2308 [Nitrospirota bacterium]MDO9287380.1 hypothetical protein [Thermodesulfovibrionales bacterium]MDP3112969.1 hypothetical protein [Thermodesulfovibrionales bacterium]